MSESVTTYADLASSRFAILDVPVLAPGVCAICGASRSDDRSYVDFGLFIEFVGQIYFCSFCITELTNRMGSLTPEQTKALEDQLDAAKQEILSFQSQKAKINDAVNLLRGTGLFDSNDPDAIAAGVETVSEFAKTRAVSDKPESKPTRSNSKAKQSDPKQGSDDIPATGSDELSDFGGF
jgi:hypothetical protein